VSGSESAPGPRRRLAFGLLLTALALLRPPAPEPGALPLLPLQVPPPDALEDGDLVFRRGRDAIAALVLAHGDGRFSHVGVVLREAAGTVVVHAIPPEDGRPGGVVREALEHFAAATLAAEIAVFRLPDLTGEERRRIRDYLQQRQGTPFDARLRMSDDETLYCTELVLRALEAAGRPIPDDLPRIEALGLAEPAIAPEALLRLPGLQPIKARGGPRPPAP
jgi:hypothetical protein